MVSKVNLLWSGRARPNVTPAAASTAAGDLLSGGPGRELSFAKLSRAPRLWVKMTGILALASSSAT